jgi:hypothetical protein
MWEKLKAGGGVSDVSWSRVKGWRRERTRMIQMLVIPLLIPVPSRRDMKVSLNFISIQTPKNPTRIRHAFQSRRLAKLLRLRLAQLLMHIREIFPARVIGILFAQLMQALVRLLARPLRPVCRLVAQEVAGECAVAGCVLHVDSQVGAAHGDDDVEVYLHVVGDALFDGEGLRRCAGEPARYLGPREVYACEDEGDGPCGGVATFYEVCLFRFGWW